MLMTSPVSDRSVSQFRGAIKETARAPHEALDAIAGAVSEDQDRRHTVLRSLMTRGLAIQEYHTDRLRRTFDMVLNLYSHGAARDDLPSVAFDYLRDRLERTILTLDTLRERGDIFAAHEAAGCPPVLVYDYEVILDGADLPHHRSNYTLLRILPPEGVVVDNDRRPYMIIDPRAGHGSGIGGFKTDSQVGVAMTAGHPVYFVSFSRTPVDGQTLADVTQTEAAFVREIMRRHPNSAKPVVIGNCQGGWATLLLAATNPDLTGPIVLNGAPVAPWSGIFGGDVMRYSAGITGGTAQAMLMSDLGNGKFDGANLVHNFEVLNPSRNYFRKYYDLFAKVDTERSRFLEFEKWWGGFFLLNEQEIHWIVEQLFVGNRIVKNVAQLEPGRTIDVKKVRAPIIVFASQGDNITPPPQALNWIVDSYADVDEIRIRGQRIVYMVHDEVGHLGIFVSSNVAKKEHTEVTSTMRTIEALAPGLYEMRIEAAEGSGHNRAFSVSFAERTLDNLRALDPERSDEIAFAGVARASEQQAEFYDVMVRPFVQAMTTEWSAEMRRRLHPLRVQRSIFASANPMMVGVHALARQVEANRRPAVNDNPFITFELAIANLIEQSMDLVRDLREVSIEATFYNLWLTPWARSFGRSHAVSRTLKDPAELAGLPEVRLALLGVERGGFVEAVIRMLLLLADSRHTVRRDRLERSAEVLTEWEPFRDLGADARARIIYEQTLITRFATEHSINALTILLPTAEDRQKALETIRYVVGPEMEMSPETLTMISRLGALLDDDGTIQTSGQAAE